jgi:DNA-binding SARP family transcriptional activator/predicted ATPase
MERMLRLTLFGAIQVTLDGSPVDLPYRKSLALLSYLATTGQPHSREALSALLWGESSEDRARASLRTALWHLNEPLESFLIVDRQSVAFDQDTPHWVDVVEFGEYIGSVREATRGDDDADDAPPLTDRQAALLDDAVELYRGEFMAGFAVRNAPDFEDWMLRQREWCRDLAVRALYRLVAYHKAKGEYREGLDSAAQLLVIAPWQEEAHRERMKLLALSGRRNAALAQYEACRQLLKEFLDAEPTLETELLYREIKAGKLTTAPVGGSGPLGLHRASPCSFVSSAERSLVGRDDEVGRLKRLLLEPDMRLVSLVGPDGVGKTRLACSVVGSVAKQFEQAAWFVPMDPYARETESWMSDEADGRCGLGEDNDLALVSAIGRTLGATFCTNRSPAEQLYDYVHHRELLLVLDGFAPSAAQEEVVLGMLRHAPSVRILTTTREPLGLEIEHVMPIHGLSVPERLAEHSSLEEPLEAAMAHAAIRLFTQCARKADVGFGLRHDNVRHVVQICRLIAGLPLPIELAASWAGKVPLAAMAADIEWRLRQAEGRSRADSPGLVVEAVLSYVWDLLSSDEQRALLQLTCFAGDFGVDAAVEIVGVASRGLQSLCRKRLLTNGVSDRYRLHAAVRRCLLRQVKTMGASGMGWDGSFDPDHTRERMCASYLCSLERQAPALRGPEAKKASAQIRRDWSHIRRAWCRSVSEADRDRLRGSLDGLSRFLLLQGWYLEGSQLLDAAASVLLPHGRRAEEGEDARLGCRLLTEKARFLNEQMRHEEAAEVAATVVEVASAAPPGDVSDASRRALQANAYLEWGKALYPRGELSGGRDHIERALALAADEGCDEVEAASLHHLGIIALECEAFDDACRQLDRALHLYDDLGDWLGKARALSALSLLNVGRRHLDRAEDQANEALTIAGAMGYRAGQAVAHTCLCRIGQAGQDRLSAAIHGRHGLLIARDIGEPRREGQALRELGWLLVEEGNVDKAWNYGLLAVELARLVGHPGDEAQAWLLTANVLTELGMPDQAEHAYKEALRIQGELEQFGAVAESQAGLASLSLQRGLHERARALVEGILVRLDGGNLLGARDPVSIYLACYQVLSAVEDDRAEVALEMASRIYDGGAFSAA